MYNNTRNQGAHYGKLQAGLNMKIIILNLMLASVFSLSSCILDITGDLDKRSDHENTASDDTEKEPEPESDINVQQSEEDLLSESGTYDFGSFQTGTNSPEITFTIQNTGDADLVLSNNPSLASSTNFTITENPAEITILPGGFTSFKIQFHPQSDGTLSTVVSINNNDPDEGTYTFTVSGTGIGTVENPTFSLTAGTYTTDQNLNLLSNTSSATICYSSHASSPTDPECDTAKTGCTTGTMFSGSAITVSTDLVFKAVACKTGYIDSSIEMRNYVIDRPPTAPSSLTTTTGPAGNHQVDLQWGYSPDDKTAPTSMVYQICYSTSASGCDSFAGTLVYSGIGEIIATIFNNLAPSTTYYFRIRARDSNGSFSSPFPASGSVSGISSN